MSNWREKGTIKRTSFGFSQQFEVSEQGHVDLTEDAIEAFSEVAFKQRMCIDSAEEKMNIAQKAIGGSVMSGSIEHVGDITHRMTHHAKYGDLYPELVEEKVVRMVRVLGSKYGFLREFNEDIDSNFDYHKDITDKDAYIQAINQSLEAYSESHAKIPVFNKPQWHAREAAILLGKKDIFSSLTHLRVLHRMIKDQTLLPRCAEVFRDKSGKIIEFEASHLRLDFHKKNNENKLKTESISI
jgi:hypothetical protein